MENKDLISIIIPVYNGEKYIYLSGSFNHTIISLQSFISFGKSKIDIGK